MDHKQLSLPARILLIPWRVLNWPIYRLSKFVRARTVKGSILWQFSSYSALRVIATLGLIAAAFLLGYYYKVLAEQTRELLIEFARAALVYPAAETLVSFFIQAEEEI